MLNEKNLLQLLNCKPSTLLNAYNLQKKAQKLAPALNFDASCQRKNIFPTGLGASPCTKPIWDSSESSSQAEPFITNRPCSPSTPNVHCHRVHSISYLRQQMQRCISFPIPGNR